MQGKWGVLTMDVIDYFTNQVIGTGCRLMAGQKVEGPMWSEEKEYD